MVADAVIAQPCEVRFQILWRHVSGEPDTVLVETTRAFEREPGPLDRAQAYEHRARAPAVDAVAGDLLVWRFEQLTGPPDLTAYIPNGEGARYGGRIPFIQRP